jgi:hypothetical protein
MWIDLKLTKEEALVLFEMLARWEDRNLINYLDDAVGLDSVLFDHGAEAKVLSVALHGQLETILAEPFSKDYETILNNSRHAVIESTLGSRRD